MGGKAHQQERGRQHETGEDDPAAGQRCEIGLPGAQVRRGRAPGICLEHE
jgi:hypothetical protein